MSEANPVHHSAVKCETCGAPAIVHISDVRDGVATMEHYCAACVESIERTPISINRLRGDAAILFVFGGITFLISLFADSLHFGEGEGFGWRQRQGLLISLVLLILGAAARARTILVIGLVGAGLSVLADWLGFGSDEGFGMQQKMGCLVGITLVAAGAWIARRSA